MSLNPNSASGSATGNPRNKTALKPGFSLVGWIRLANSGEDLTRTGGKRFPVSKEELAKHCTADDCWIAVRGRVYNITRYLEYHPGGMPELMRGAGKDATKLFDEFHAWVNIDQLLAKCFIGPLKTTVTLDLSNSPDKSKKPSIFSAPSPIPEEPERKISTRIIPRFDWIQKKGDLMIYYYTKGLCNAGLTVKRICDKECEATIYIGRDSHSYKFSFLNALQFPPKIFINQESGKIEMTFVKEVEEVWSNFGIFEKIKTTLGEDTSSEYYECEIIHREFINHDTFELTLRPKDEQIFVPSIGFHYNFKHGDVFRSYTPVPSSFINNKSNQFDLHFIIKKYESGVLSSHLAETSEEVLLSRQRGSLDLSQLKDHTGILLLAAGSGITPFMRLIEFFLSTNRV